MPATESKPLNERLLDPVDRISEVLFGLIMVLTFTGAISTQTDQREVTLLLVAALGCNLAWGIVDGVMFVMLGLVERARGRRLLHELRTNEPATGRAMIVEWLPPPVVPLFDDDELESIRRNVVEIPEPTASLVRSDDIKGGLMVAVIVFLSTFPVVIPFLVVDGRIDAIRMSNGVAVAMMFGCGVQLGRYAGVARPALVGAALAAVGIVLVVITILLGG
jgi:hypothetical protein